MKLITASLDSRSLNVTRSVTFVGLRCCIVQSTITQCASPQPLAILLTSNPRFIYSMVMCSLAACMVRQTEAVNLNPYGAADAKLEITITTSSVACIYFKCLIFTRRGFWVENMMKMSTTSATRFMWNVIQGTNKRVIATTNLNECYSRSHSVLFLTGSKDTLKSRNVILIGSGWNWNGVEDRSCRNSARGGKDDQWIISTTWRIKSLTQETHTSVILFQQKKHVVYVPVIGALFMLLARLGYRQNHKRIDTWKRISSICSRVAIIKSQEWEEHQQVLWKGLSSETSTIEAFQQLQKKYKMLNVVFCWWKSANISYSTGQQRSAAIFVWKGMHTDKDNKRVMAKLGLSWNHQGDLLSSQDEANKHFWYYIIALCTRNERSQTRHQLISRLTSWRTRSLRLFHLHSQMRSMWHQNYHKK